MCLQKTLDSCPTSVRLVWASAKVDESKPVTDEPAPVKEASVVFSFSEAGYGFGEIALVVDADGQHYLDTESMGLDRVKRYLNMVLDSAIDDQDQDPEKHLRFNKVMNRRCGPGCPVCSSRPT